MAIFLQVEARVWQSFEAEKTITHDMTKDSGMRIAGDLHLRPGQRSTQGGINIS